MKSSPFVGWLNVNWKLSLIWEEKDQKTNENRLLYKDSLLIYVTVLHVNLEVLGIFFSSLCSLPNLLLSVRRRNY